MKKLVKNFAQYINECGCTSGAFLPEADGDMGLDATGAGVKNQTGAMVMEDEEEDDGSKAKKVTVTVKDSRGTFQELLNKIQELGNEGVSFEIAITPEGSDDEGVERFFWDSDGDDSVESIEVEGEESEDSEEDVDDAEYEDSEDENEEDIDDEEENEDLEENFKEGDAVGVKIKDMKGPQTGGKHVVNEKTITQKDGSYPISGKESLRKAQHAFGRSKNKAATKKHIVSAAKKLGLSDELSDKWK